VIVIGVVGDIASGKTYVSQVFESLGYRVFNADKIVHAIYRNNNRINLKISKLFKLKLYKKRINLKDLVNLIINSKIKLQLLNKIIHPEVKKKLLIFIKKNKKKKLTILDIPLLLETNFKVFADVIIFIDTKKNDLIKFRKKRKIDTRLVEVLEKFHFDKVVKKEMSDFIIRNSNLKFLKSQIKTIIDTILLDD